MIYCRKFGISMVALVGRGAPKRASLGGNLCADIICKILQSWHSSGDEPAGVASPVACSVACSVTWSVTLLVASPVTTLIASPVACGATCGVASPTTLFFR
jgi:hypothetical protein